MRNLAGLVKRAAAPAAAVALLACSTSKAPQTRVDAEALATALRSRFARDARLANAANVDVDARTGIVRLSGHVRTSEERASAGRLACSVKGVRTVYNEIEVTAER